MIQYAYCKDLEYVIKHVADSIQERLTMGDSILWLIPGGSGIKASVEIANIIRTQDLSRLYITLSDERYGEVCHKDENWKQLLDAEFCLPGIAASNMYRPLCGEDKQNTAIKYSKWLKETRTRVDFAIGLLGIGADGHIGGIKPHSLAVSSDDCAVVYDSEDYIRVSATSAFLAGLDEVVVQAIGKSKHETIHKLLHEDMSEEEQPAQVLKRIENSTLYTDYKD